MSLTERRVGVIPDKACKQLFAYTQIKLLPPRFFQLFISNLQQIVQACK
ncbi:hypothetical protein BACCELL_05448 [Bacteroides cellulosilyticus DSM 14838]|uniref:Uncharacterized protein n=1 Tax=Bacteroides cellulosilyticus DSM 14838 TaxID=537012 RepID=E2NMA3_9BACE|nr:hypothetical protein BACCELL_05448 [Bacteroides cellulosilyticus DSM 14838]